MTSQPHLQTPRNKVIEGRLAIINFIKINDEYISKVDKIVVV